MYKTKFYYNSDVWDTVMILYVICQLVCVIDSWAHTSFVHSILSLKLGVTVSMYIYILSGKKWAYKLKRETHKYHASY